MLRMKNSNEKKKEQLISFLNEEHFHEIDEADSDEVEGVRWLISKEDK